MTQHLPYFTQAGAAIKQVRRKGMAKHVWASLLLLGHLRQMLANDAIDAGALQRSPAVAEQPSITLRTPFLKLPPHGQITPHRFGGMTPERHDALLAALAQNLDDARVGIDLVQSKAGKLGAAN